jgi:hypothetical protein
MENIRIKISDGKFGQQRFVEFEGIRSMSMQAKFAQIVWVVTQYDANDVKLTTPDIQQDRTVISPISNSNWVNPQTGITVEEGTEGAVPEFDFWWAMLQSNLLPNVLVQAIQTLDSLNRFDQP